MDKEDSDVEVRYDVLCGNDMNASEKFELARTKGISKRGMSMRCLGCSPYKLVGYQLAWQIRGVASRRRDV